MSALRLVAMLCVAVPLFARADPVVYTFSGTVYSGLPEYIGQTLQGTVTYDVSLSTTTTTCCSVDIVAQRESAVTAPGAPAYAWITLSLSGGSSFTTGNGLSSNYGMSELIKEAGEEGSPGPLNSFKIASQAVDAPNFGRVITLLTSDSLGAASTLFPDASAGLANDQAVNWLASGATATGVIGLASGGPTTETIAVFSIDSITAVPEMPSVALLLTGLALLRWRRAKQL